MKHDQAEQRPAQEDIPLVKDLEVSAFPSAGTAVVIDALTLAVEIPLLRHDYALPHCRSGGSWHYTRPGWNVRAGAGARPACDRGGYRGFARFTAWALTNWKFGLFPAQSSGSGCRFQRKVCSTSSIPPARKRPAGLRRHAQRTAGSGR